MFWLCQREKGVARRGGQVSGDFFSFVGKNGNATHLIYILSQPNLYHFLRDHSLVSQIERCSLESTRGIVRRAIVSSAPVASKMIYQSQYQNHNNYSKACKVRKQHQG